MHFTSNFIALMLNLFVSGIRLNKIGVSSLSHKSLPPVSGRTQSSPFLRLELLAKKRSDFRVRVKLLGIAAHRNSDIER